MRVIMLTISMYLFLYAHVTNGQYPPCGQGKYQCEKYDKDSYKYGCCASTKECPGLIGTIMRIDESSPRHDDCKDVSYKGIFCEYKPKPCTNKEKGATIDISGRKKPVKPKKTDLTKDVWFVEQMKKLYGDDYEKTLSKWKKEGAKPSDGLTEDEFYRKLKAEDEFYRKLKRRKQKAKERRKKKKKAKREKRKKEESKRKKEKKRPERKGPILTVLNEEQLARKRAAEERARKRLEKSELSFAEMDYVNMINDLIYDVEAEEAQEITDIKRLNAKIKKLKSKINYN